MESTRCNLCGSDEAELYRQGPDRQLAVAGPFRLVRCRQCGLIYLNPRPGPGEIGGYYPESYEPFTRSDRYQGGRLARWNYRRYLAKRCRRLARARAPGRLLDVGCATGEFLALAREQGWQAQGVELSPAAARAARDRHGLEVFTGDLAGAAFADASFDAVTMWDVLEHVADPRAELAEVRRILKYDGVFIVELPNLRSFDAALFGPYWIGLDMPRHFHVFPASTLAVLLQESGFRIRSRRCSSGGYGAFAASLAFWAADRPQPWLRRAAAAVAGARTLPFVLWPYVYLAYALGRGPEVAITCLKAPDDGG